MLNLGELGILIKVDDDGSITSLKRFSDEADNAEKKSLNLKDSLKKLAGRFAIGYSIKEVATGLVNCGKSAAEFESSFAKVSTLLDESKTDFGEYKDTILDASSETGVAVGELAESVYGSISAGVDSTKAVEFTTEAIKLAKGGFTDTAKAVDVMTTAINGYGMSADDATKISDMLIVCQNEGKTTVDELSSSMGAVIPIASASNFQIDELSAAYATLTKNGIATSESGTYLKGMLGELTKSGSTTDKVLRDLSGKGFAELKAEGKSTTEILGMLDENAKSNGKTLKDMFGSVEAGSAAMVLMKGDGTEYNEILQAMQESAGATGEAFDKMAATPEEKMAMLKNSIHNMGIQLGEVLLPIVMGVADFVTEHMPEIQAVVTFVIETIKVLFDGLSEAISALVKSAQTEGTYFNMVWKEIQIVFETVFKALQDIFAIFTAVFSGDWAAAWNGIKTLFADLWEGIKALLAVKLKGMLNLLKGMVGAFRDVGVNLIKGLWNGIASVKAWIYDKIKGFVNGITDVVKAFFGIHSPSLVFKEIGKYLVEGLAIGIEENASFAADEMEKLCSVILGQADEISTGILERDAKTGKLVMANTYKNIKEKIDLYYKDRDVRIATMDKSSQENIKTLQKDVKATENATKAQIEMFKAVAQAKSQSIDDETNEVVNGLQSQLDAIDKAEEQRNREKDSEEYDTKLNGLYDKLNSTSGEENIKVATDIEKLKAERKETLRKQDIADEKDAIRAKMDEARQEANKKKKLLEEELKQKTYNLEQQRNKEIEHMNKVIELMQIQVDKKAELEKIQTEIKDKEKKLQTKNIDKETKLQTKNELSELKEQEKNLKTSLSEGEKNLENFTPKILEISRGYGDVMLSGFKSTEGNILSYVDSLCDEIRRRIKAASKAKKADGSHRTGLDYVPFDDYAAVLHKGEMVLTQAEADRYKKGENSVKNNSNITQNFYGVKEERTAFEVSRQTKKTIRQLGLA